MDKLRMQSADGVQDNIKKIGELFPDCVEEALDEKGNPVFKVDWDKLRQNLSGELLSENEERYQFTWPDKRKAILAANAPINATLRPCREESVDFDNTQNLYIEGDNLDVLKCLKETYLHKVKMIYIDPPYNTGNDFVYEDDFAENSEEYLAKSGQFDNQGNRLVANTESNGRFHTDWLNMIYPRLKVARDLLTDDGVIFISIDDNEQENLKKVCNEIFGEKNFVACINWRRSGGRQDSKYYAIIHEYILCFAKNAGQFDAGEEVKGDDIYPKYDEQKKRYYKTQLLRKWGSNSLRENRPNLYYSITAPDGSAVFPMIYSWTPESATLNEIQGRWRWSASNLARAVEEGRIEFQKNEWGKWVAYEKIFAPAEGEEKTKKYTTWIDDLGNGTNDIKELFSKTIFEYSKSHKMIGRFINMAGAEDEDIILDFFSGSATTAHAVMQLNAEDEGKRKFILVQLPELTDEKSEAYKAGYKNICEIGKERIRRAGRKIKEESPLTTRNLDTGFRVLKLDSTNMEDVYYAPSEIRQSGVLDLVDNVKEDRTGEDLLFQVMLELGATLDSKIEVMRIGGKTVYNVAEKYLVACFDEDVTDEVVEEMAKMKPQYAVLRDTSMKTDSTATNFDQIFKTYSPDTIAKIL
ncbi:MAG: site-specific DNA-methyltransferase [Bacteroidales bacterium]|nr:site-specific DNA-methyltransferase [Bacteroidales bacterium]